MTTSPLLIDALRALKNGIGNDIQLRVSAFHSETGLTPSAVDVDMLEVTTNGSPVREYVVGRVGIRLDL